MCSDGGLVAWGLQFGASKRASSAMAKDADDDGSATNANPRMDESATAQLGHMTWQRAASVHTSHLAPPTY
jgi:hypothetical protein